MRRGIFRTISIILISVAAAGCSVFDWSLGNLGAAGINARLTGTLQVDGDVHELATYQGKLYALAAEGSAQVFYEIDEETFELVRRYELAGGTVEGLDYSDRNEGPRLSCFEDSAGTFFIMDRSNATRFWLSQADETAMYLSAGDNYNNLNVYFSSAATGFDYIIRYYRSSAIEIWDLVSDTVVTSLNPPPDKFLYDAVEIEKDGIEYLRLFFYPFVPVDSEDERVRLSVRLTSIDLEYGTSPPLDYPYGAAELAIDISGEKRWNGMSPEPGFPVKFPSITYFRSGARYFMLNSPDILNNGVMLFEPDGTYFETLFLGSDMKPVISDSLPFVYGLQGNRILKYSLE